MNTDGNLLGNGKANQTAHLPPASPRKLEERRGRPVPGSSKSARGRAPHAPMRPWVTAR